MSESPRRCLVACARDILLTEDAFEKATKTKLYAQWWQSDASAQLLPQDDQATTTMPASPARPSKLQIVAMHQVKQGSRKSFVHSLAHAESNAIDLMWDNVGRFAHLQLPRAFCDDWVRIAVEEAEHFESWATRLKELGSFYGEFPVHEGLWDSAHATAGDLLARLAVVHLVHEARGLDVFPKAVARFERAQDQVSLDIIHKNYNQEKGHVATAVKWFKFVCKQHHKEPVPSFQSAVKEYFRGALKPPFNTDARLEAGLTEEWYLPLSE